MEHKLISKLGSVPIQEDNQVKVVYVTAVLDVMAALINNSVDGNFYMFDNNTLDGSTGQGTEKLNSVLQPGDMVIWLVSGMEVETFCDIKSITGPAVAAFDINKDRGYWMGIAKEGVAESFEYNLEIQVESKVLPMTSKPVLQLTAGDKK